MFWVTQPHGNTVVIEVWVACMCIHTPNAVVKVI